MKGVYIGRDSVILTLLFASLSGLAMTVLFALCPTLSFWWRLPVWLGFYVATVLVYVLAVVFGLYFFLPKGDPSPKRRRFTHGIMKLTLRWVLVMLGMRVKVDGSDKLPDAPYLFVSNHRSAFDPLCVIPEVAAPIVFVAKPGVLGIPVIGSILGRIGFLAIDRENARNAVATIKRSAELIKDVGLSVGIYPEGTRSKTGNLLPFHAGSFKIAKLANCPVAVATVRYEKRGLLPWNKRVHIHIVDVMDAAYVAENGTAQMAERAETAIREDLGL